MTIWYQMRRWKISVKDLIVKGFGHSVGFNYIHNKLLALWKPAGRLDYVPLG